MNEIDDDTICYVMRYCRDYFTPEESTAYMHYLYSTKAGNSEVIRNKLMERGIISKDPEVLKLLVDGEEEFQKRVAMRIVKEHVDVLNKCPMCGKLTRTPKAMQCRFCWHDWH